MAASYVSTLTLPIPPVVWWRGRTSFVGFMMEMWRHLNYLIAGFFFVVTAMSLVAVWWNVNHFRWQTFVLQVILWFIAGITITIYYHRYATHQAFEMRRSIQAVMLLFSNIAVMPPEAAWVPRHRSHHKNPEHPELDPYPMYPGFWGFWWTHVGCIVFKVYQDDTKAIERERQRDYLVRWQYDYYLPLAFLMAFVVPTFIGAWWGDALGAFLGCFPRLFLVYNGASFVNSGAHSTFFGNKPFGHKSSAVQINQTTLGRVMCAFSLDEAKSHEKHHKDQSAWSAHEGFNITDSVIVLLRRLGLVWNLRE